MFQALYSTFWIFAFFRRGNKFGPPRKSPSLRGSHRQSLLFMEIIHITEKLTLIIEIIRVHSETRNPKKWDIIKKP